MAERVRVVEVVYGFSVEASGGGAGRFAIELAQRLEPNRFEAVVCGLWDTGTQFERERIQALEAQGIQAFAAVKWDPQRPYQSFVRALPAMRQRLFTPKGQILHSHSEFGDMAIVALKASLKNTVCLRTVHNGHPIEWRKRPLRRLLLTNFLYPLVFWKEIGVNQGIVARLNRRRAAQLAGAEAVQMPNAIDLQRFERPVLESNALRRSLGVPEEAPLVASVGRLAEEKGLDTYLRAAALVLQDLPQARFLLVGEGEMEAELKALARELGIQTQVTFTGARNDVEDLLAAVDVLVSASLWEGISTVILESMAAGTPVVASEIPGNREIIEDQVHGWLVPVNNSKALAEAVKSTLTNNDLRERIVESALQRVQVFSIQRLVSQHEALYQRAAERFGLNLDQEHG
jgi:glycosyltransferase involved in cell wall biosynthesis